jgi:hypothetical protein
MTSVKYQMKKHIITETNVKVNQPRPLKSRHFVFIFSNHKIVSKLRSVLNKRENIGKGKYFRVLIFIC